MKIFFGCYQNIFWAKMSQPPRKIDPYAYALSAPPFALAITMVNVDQLE